MRNDMLNLKSIFLIESEFYDAGIPEIILNTEKYKKYYDSLVNAEQAGAIRNQDHKDVSSALSEAREKDLEAISREILSSAGFEEMRRREEDAANEYLEGDHNKRQWAIFHGDEFKRELYDHLGWSERDLKKSSVLGELKWSGITEKRLNAVLKLSNIDSTTKSLVEDALKKVSQWKSIIDRVKVLKGKIVKRGQEGFADVKKQSDIQEDISSFLYFVGRLGTGYVYGSSPQSTSRAAMEVVKRAFDQGIRKLDDILELVRPNPKYSKKADHHISQAYDRYAIKHGVSDTMTEDQMRFIIDEFDKTFDKEIQQLVKAYRNLFDEQWSSWQKWLKSLRGTQRDKLRLPIKFLLWLDPSFPIGNYEKGTKEYEKQQSVAENSKFSLMSTYHTYSNESEARERLEKDIQYFIESEKSKLHQNIVKYLRNLDIKSVEKLYIDRAVKGFEGQFKLELADGSIRYFRTFAFKAGGHNIQIAHYRYRSNLSDKVQPKYSQWDEEDYHWDEEKEDWS
jgi:hypothetical protein